MKKFRNVCASAALAMLASGTALAETSASIGIMSDYIFRGLWTSDASAFASIDVETDSGAYFGAWSADIQNGLEYDIYAGYAGGTDNISWNVGFTGYYATDEAFQTAEELNLGFSIGFMSIDYALGDLENPIGAIMLGEEIKQTYQYLGATFEPEKGPYYFLGHTDYQNVSSLTGTGSHGYWFEVGKNFEVMDDIEIGVAALYALSAQKPGSTTPRSVQLSATNPFAEFAMVVTLTKNIGIGN